MSNPAIDITDFYTIQVAPGGGFGVGGWNDKTILSIHRTQREAHAEAKRLNIEGHATAPVELPEPLLRAAALRAEIDGKSMADWIASVLDDRLRDEELNDRLWKRHAEGASPRSLREILSLGGNNPPDPGDELEP
jgi:hypothetical protein